MHPICGADVEIPLGYILMAICKIEDTRVLKKATDDRDDLDIFRETFDPWL